MKSPREEVKKGFGERLRQAMVSSGYDPKPAVLEREFNARYTGDQVTLHGVRRWLLGETIPTEDKLITLALWLKVEPHVLRWGATAQKVRKEKQSWEDAIGFRERETFEAFLALTGPQKKIIREVIMAFSKLRD